MSEYELRPIRQWVTLKQGSLDTRLGTSIIPKIAQDLKTSVGRPRAAIIGAAKGTDKDVIETLRRALTDAGFYVHKVKLATGKGSCSMEEVEKLWRVFDELDITSDDVFCAFGDEGALSVASFACGRWRQGMPLALISLDMAAAVGAAITPRSLDFAGVPEVIGHAASARMTICDSDLVVPDPDSASARLAFARMACAAITDDEKAFARLWDRAAKMVDGDATAIYDQLADTMRTRGRVTASTSIAVRQSSDFANELMPVMRKLAGKGVDEGALLADTLRFLTRLGVAEAKLPFDDMLAVDELLETLGFEELEADFSGKKMAKALREDRFTRLNRCMILLPQTLGRVRLCPVGEDVLLEHCEAWVDARS